MEIEDIKVSLQDLRDRLSESDARLNTRITRLELQQKGLSTSFYDLEGQLKDMDKKFETLQSSIYASHNVLTGIETKLEGAIEDIHENKSTIKGFASGIMQAIGATILVTLVVGAGTTIFNYLDRSQTDTPVPIQNQLK